MSLAKASLWTAASTLVKIGAGLLVGKLLAVSFGPAGLGLAANFRQLITVLGVLALPSTMIIRNSCAAWSALHQRWYLVSLR